MFTDMVGYTALTQSNEELAMEVLERHNRLLRPIFPKFHGREVKTIGDSFLVEFESALDATRCALEIQRFLHDYNLSSRDEWKITLRIGLHIGDVIHQGSDVLGDAVNIASRLQPLADPEGVCISDQVYGQVRNKIPLSFVRLAPQELKNVRFPVDLYKIVMPWEKEPTSPSSPEGGNNRIAVLPFTNMSPDPQDEFFADGITEEVISTASKIKGLSVISRTSVMRYKQTNKGTIEIGRELGAHKLLEGSVRKSGNRLRITAQLIDALDDEHLWAETYDRDLKDVFEIQSEIAEKVARSMEANLLRQDMDEIRRGPTKNSEAHLAYLKGLHFMNRGTVDAYPKAIDHFERAIAADPNFALAYAALADCYIYMAGQYMPAKSVAPKAKELALKAVGLDDTLANGHTSLGNIHMQFEWDWDGADRELSRAIELNPNYSNAHMWRGVYLALTRRAEEGVRELQTAEELDPLSPLTKMNSGLLLYYAGRYDEALSKLHESKELEEGDELTHLMLGLTYDAKGMPEAAIKEMRNGLLLGEYADVLAGLGYSCALAGKKDEAIEALKRLDALGDRAMSPRTNAAIVYIGLGDFDKAIELMENALVSREDWLALTCQFRVYDPIRTDPRFISIVRSIGLPT